MNDDEHFGKVLCRQAQKRAAVARARRAIFAPTAHLVRAREECAESSVSNISSLSHSTLKRVQHKCFTLDTPRKAQEGMPSQISIPRAPARPRFFAGSSPRPVASAPSWCCTRWRTRGRLLVTSIRLSPDQWGCLVTTSVREPISIARARLLNSSARTGHLPRD